MAHSGRRAADETLIAELAAGKSVRSAASTANVSERTAFRRLDDPVFRARITQLRSEMISSAAGHLSASMLEAANVLRDGLTDPDINIRHKSAVKLIELGIKITELVDMENRVTDLEKKLSDEVNK